jgi:cell division protein FtsQ
MSSVFELRNGTERQGSIGRWARPLLVSLMVLCALFLLAHFVAVPLTQIHHVVVQSDVPLTDEQVLAISGISSDEHWLTVRTAAIENRLEANPLIRHAVVRRVFPDTVNMTVWGRQPVGLVLAQSDGRSLPVLVDGEGVVFKVGVTNSDVDLPVISGLSVGEIGLGARLPSAFSMLFSDLKTLREKSPSLYGLLSEVRVVATSDTTSGARLQDDFEALLYLTSSAVPIRIRGSIDESLMKYTLLVLDLLSKQGVLKDIQELDFRSGDVVYRLSGQSTGAAPGVRSTSADQNARSTVAGSKGG